MGSVQSRRHRFLEVEHSQKDYDVTIHAESFYSLLIGDSWQINIKDWPSYLERTKKATSQIAVLGYEKTGKSFILSKLLKRKLPQGKHVKTNGLSILYPDSLEYPWIAVDTPGTNVSIKTEQMSQILEKYFQEKNLSENEKMRMLFGDNILMEALLQEFVILNAQVILIVIGKLRRDDQRLINRIKALPGKRVMIVHNLLDTLDRENVEDIIKEDIFGAFNISNRVIRLDGMNPKKNNNIVYLENSQNNFDLAKSNKKLCSEDEKNIEHIIMAHENSPAGAYYNKSAIFYIREVINAYNHCQSFDLIKAFSRYLNEKIMKYLSSQEKTFPEDAFEVINQDEVPIKIQLKENTKYDLKLSSANEFGNIQTYTREGLENVPFSVKVVSQVAKESIYERVLQIEFEIAGDCNDNQLEFLIREIDNYVQIKISGTSKDNTVKDKNIETLFENTRKFGNFSIVTEKTDITGYTINKAERPEITRRVPGLITVTFNLHRLPQRVT